MYGQRPGRTGSLCGQRRLSRSVRHKDSRYCVDPAWSRIGVQVQHPRFELFQFNDEKWDEQVLPNRRLYPMKKPTQHLIAEVPRRQPWVAMTIGIDLGDVWSHPCTLNQVGEVVDPTPLPDAPEGDREVVLCNSRNNSRSKFASDLARSCRTVLNHSVLYDDKDVARMQRY